MPSIIPTSATEWDSAHLDAVNHLQYISTGTWQRANAKNVRNFSAIGFNYARILADSLQCHVGIISNAVGGSGCEDWIDLSKAKLRLPKHR